MRQQAQNALFRESDTPRARLYVSRRLRSGALVHAVAPLRADVRTQECTQTGENGLSAQPPLACRECRVCPLVRPTRRMRFSVTSRRSGGVGQPPLGCGALWRMPQLGKCARATPRQAAGWVARGFAGLGLEFGLTERCTLPNRWAAECAFPSRRDRRMCFSVRCRLQSALFRRATLRLPR